MARPVVDQDGRIQGLVIINIFGRDLPTMLEPVKGSRLFPVGENGG